MRYHATAGSKHFVAEIEGGEDHRYLLTIDGQRYEIDWAPIRPGAASMMIGERSYSVHHEEEGDEISVYLRSQPFLVDVANEQRFRLRRLTSKFEIEGRQVVSAPMPGKVVRVMVALGDEVREGQGLVVVEAMKMENELKSPKAGKIVELPAQEGSTVEKNARLAVVE